MVWKLSLSMRRAVGDDNKTQTQKYTAWCVWERARIGPNWRQIQPNPNLAPDWLWSGKKGKKGEQSERRQTDGSARAAHHRKKGMSPVLGGKKRSTDKGGPNSSAHRLLPVVCVIWARAQDKTRIFFRFWVSRVCLQKRGKGLRGPLGGAADQLKASSTYLPRLCGLYFFLGNKKEQKSALVIWLPHVSIGQTLLNNYYLRMAHANACIACLPPSGNAQQEETEKRQNPPRTLQSLISAREKKSNCGNRVRQGKEARNVHFGQAPV
nr:hypothetical protein [Pandoravirus massiliensis]